MGKDSSNQRELEQLTAFIRERRDARELKRGLAVKLSLEKYPYHQIQSIVEVSIGFISKWKKAFLAHGVKGLTLGYKGAKPGLNPQEKAAVINWLKSKDNWNLRELRNYLSDNYQIEFKAKKSYYKLFKAAGISWKKSQKKNPKKDPKKVEEKRKEITQFLQDHQEEISQGNLSIFIIDECHLLWGDICPKGYRFAYGYVWGRTNERVEVPMTNERYKQTYFGALDYHPLEFLVKPYEKADSEKTVEFLKYLQKKRPGQRIAVIWDGASYHRYDKMKEYLEEINSQLSQSQWQVTCILFAPHAPSLYPVEDIWLMAKKAIRENYYICESFKEVKQVFIEKIEGKRFSFPKVYKYG